MSREVRPPRIYDPTAQENAPSSTASEPRNMPGPDARALLPIKRPTPRSPKRFPPEEDRSQMERNENTTAARFNRGRVEAAGATAASTTVTDFVDMGSPASCSEGPPKILPDSICCNAPSLLKSFGRSGNLGTSPRRKKKEFSCSWGGSTPETRRGSVCCGGMRRA
jgi:hypothetical protein